MNILHLCIRNEDTEMKIKVCGMKYPENMNELRTIPVDMMGMIFYEQSPRCIGKQHFREVNALSLAIPKVGVFVDSTIGNILDTFRHYRLHMVQLHGDETPEFCNELRNTGIQIIKALAIETKEDLKKCAVYNQVCDYFLFDTQTAQHGGSGKKFDWQILSAYQNEKPFFLSGGINPDDAVAIRELRIPQLYAIDLNSRFETAPGWKDIEKLKKFILNLKNTDETENTDFNRKYN